MSGRELDVDAILAGLGEEVPEGHRSGLVAIVGRPNVGKSALFNRICGKRISIVDEQEGITRDRLYAEAEAFGEPFILIDTGGIDPSEKMPFNREIRRPLSRIQVAVLGIQFWRRFAHFARLKISALPAVSHRLPLQHRILVLLPGLAACRPANA